MLILTGYLVGFLFVRVIILPLLLVKTKMFHLYLEDSLVFLEKTKFGRGSVFYSEYYLKGNAPKKEMDEADNAIKDIVLSNGSGSIFLYSVVYPFTFLALLITFLALLISYFCYFVFTKISKALTLLASYMERKFSFIPAKKDKEIDQAKSSYRAISYKK